MGVRAYGGFEERDTIPKPDGLGFAARVQPVLFDARSTNIQWIFDERSIAIRWTFNVFGGPLGACQGRFRWD
jgi:hypothetical protein